MYIGACSDSHPNTPWTLCHPCLVFGKQQGCSHNMANLIHNIY